MNIFANHAPLWVFALLGAIIAVLAVVLYFANTPGGGDHDYLYADPTRNYYMNIPPKWQILDSGRSQALGHIKVTDHSADSNISEENA